MKKIALLTLLLINLSLSFSLPRNQASPAIFSVTQSAGTILFRHTDSTQTIIPCQSVASIVSNADPSKIVSVWVVQQGDYDKIMQFDYSVCGFSTKQEAVDSVTVWASCVYVSDSAYTTILYTNTDSATITSYDVLNSQNAPPGSPATGDTYLVGTSPSGAWVGHAKDIAEWNGSSWDFTDGVQGDFLYNATTALTYIFRSGNWVQTTGIPALHNGNNISTGLTLGTRNNKDFNFISNNIIRGVFLSNGSFRVANQGLSGNVLLGANNLGIQKKIYLGGGLSLSNDTLVSSGGAFIPLSGTVSGSPVTGDISYGIKDIDANKIFAENADGNISGLLIGQYFDDNTEEASGAGIFYKGLVSNANTGFLGVKQDGTSLISFADSVNFSSLVLDLSNFAVSSDNTSFQGINGNQDFSPNYEDLSYTQKIYVGFRGTATLSSGTVTVATDKVKTGYKIYLSVNTPSGTQGFLSAPTGSIVDVTSFVINSTNAGDNSTVNWWIAP
jgi:hypothetical protein